MRVMSHLPSRWQHSDGAVWTVLPEAAGRQARSASVPHDHRVRCRSWPTSDPIVDSGCAVRLSGTVKCGLSSMLPQETDLMLRTNSYGSAARHPPRC